MMLVRAMVADLDLLAVKPEGNPFTGLPPVVDFAALTPFQLSRSYQDFRKTILKKLIVGGGPVSLKLQQLIETIPTAVYETYGMTETCSHVALRRLNGGDAADCFTALPGAEIRQDERNCLVISAPALAGSEIITNDVVEIRGKDQFRWLGRFDHVINSGGVKLFPEQMERKLEPFLDRRFFIGALPHDALGEQVVLVLEGDAMTEPETAQLEQSMKLVLTPFEMPRSIRFIESFTTSSSGKVLKSEMLRSILSTGN
jgi:O-succinylbenzoic acid--CoA ligase